MTQGRKKSKFPALTTVPSGSYFDFVSSGANYKILDTDFYNNLGATGTIVQQGDLTGIPVLDKSGSVNGIRNIEAGSGVSASISVQDGIALRHNFTVNQIGVPIISGENDASPVVKSLIAGSGVSLDDTSTDITINASEGNFLLVDSVTDAEANSDSSIVGISITGRAGANYQKATQAIADTYPNLAKFKDSNGQDWILQRNQVIQPIFFDITGDGSTETTKTNDLVSFLNILKSFVFDGNGLEVTIDSTMFFVFCSKAIFRNFSIKAANGMPVGVANTLLLSFTASNNITLENVMVDGNRNNRVPAEVFSHSINFDRCSFISMYNVRSINAVTDGFYIASANPDIKSNHNREFLMMNCSADNCFRQGMSVIQMQHMTIIGGEFTGTNGTAPEAGIDFEPNEGDADGSISDILISNVSFRDNSGVGLLLSGVAGAGNLKVDGCNFQRNSLGGITASSKNCVISSCRFTNLLVKPARGIIDIPANPNVNNIHIENCLFENLGLNPSGTSVPCVQIHSTSGVDEDTRNFVVKDCILRADNMNYSFIVGNQTFTMTNIKIENISQPSGTTITVGVSAVGSLIQNINLYSDSERSFFIEAPNVTVKDIFMTDHKTGGGVPVFQVESSASGGTFDNIQMQNAVPINDQGFRSSASFKSIINMKINNSAGIQLLGAANSESVGFLRNNIEDDSRYTEN